MSIVKTNRLYYVIMIKYRYHGYTRVYTQIQTERRRYSILGLKRKKNLRYHE